MCDFIQAYHLPSLRAVVKENRRMIVFSSFCKASFDSSVLHKRPVASILVYTLIIFVKSV